MARIHAIDPAKLTGRPRQLVEQVKVALGLVPNMVATMANSPATLEGYVRFSGSLSGGTLPPRLREQLALAVANANDCDYCVAAHATLGSLSGLEQSEIYASLKGASSDPRTEAALRFARSVAEKRGQISDEDLQRVRRAGWSDAEIVEIVAHVALNTFTNYFNKVAQTDLDFPPVVIVAA